MKSSEQVINAAGPRYIDLKNTMRRITEENFPESARTYIEMGKFKVKEM
jgi:hypothetical protein